MKGNKKNKSNVIKKNLNKQKKLKVNKLLPLAESFFRNLVSRPGMAKTGVQRVVGGGGATKYRTNRLISADSAIWPRAKTPDLGPRARTPVRPPVFPLFTPSQNCQKSLFY